METPEYQVSPADITAALRQNWWCQMRSQRIFAIFIGGTITVFVLVLALRYGLDSAVDVRLAIGAGAYWLLVMSVCHMVRYALIPREGRKLAKDLGIFHFAQHATWTQDGITFHSPRGTSYTPWAEFYGVAKGPSVLLLRLNTRYVFFIPLSALRDDQVDEILGLHAAARGAT
ncbi:MAG: YcxB family protein [Sphingopyxis sp.]